MLWYVITVHIYIYICLVRHGNRQDAFLWFPSSTSSNVVYGFRRWFFNGFRRGGKTFFQGFLSCSSKRGLRPAEGGMPPIRHKFTTAFGMRRRAVVVASPCAAQRPRILTWLLGCVDSIPGARFQGNCICLLLACCLLVACLLLVFVCLLLPARAGRQSWEAEPRGTATCHVSVTFLVLGNVSVTFPLRFRYVSVGRLPVAPARGKCKGSLRQRAIIKETSVGAR